MIDAPLHQWIAPGEYSFCSLCGDDCRPGRQNFMCTACKSHFLGTFPSEEQVQAEREASAVVIAEREALAAARCDTGVAPLFWMTA